MEKLFYVVSYQDPGEGYHDKGIFITLFRELKYAKALAAEGEENYDHTELIDRDELIERFGERVVKETEHNFFNPTFNKFVDEDDEYDTIQDSENWVKMAAHPKAYGIEKLD